MFLCFTLSLKTTYSCSTKRIKLLIFVFQLESFAHLHLLQIKKNVFWPSCMACGILVSDQGSNQHPLQWKCGVLTTGLPGKSLLQIYLNEFSFLLLCYLCYFYFFLFPILSWLHFNWLDFFLSFHFFFLLFFKWLFEKF